LPVFYLILSDSILFYPTCLYSIFPLFYPGVAQSLGAAGKYDRIPKANSIDCKSLLCILFFLPVFYLILSDSILFYPTCLYSIFPVFYPGVAQSLGAAGKKDRIPKANSIDCKSLLCIPSYLPVFYPGGRV